MPWRPLPQIASAVAIHPYKPQTIADLPLELGDELYVIEEGGLDAQWFRGYLVAPVSVLAGLTATKGQTIEARVFSGVFPRSCVEVRDVFLDSEGDDEEELTSEGTVEEVNGIKTNGHQRNESGSLSGSISSSPKVLQVRGAKSTNGGTVTKRGKQRALTNGAHAKALPQRDPNTPKPPAPVPLLKVMEETPTSISEPLVDEISSCLREWHSTNLHELILSRQYPTLEKMQALVQTLNLSRRQFLLGVLTQHELRSLREKTVWDLVKGNKLFSNEVVVRDPLQNGRVLTSDDSAIEITKLQSMMSLLDERPQPSLQENTFLYHLLVDVKAFSGNSNESTSLVFFLATKPFGQSAVALTESYIVDVPASGALTSLAKSGQMRTLFTELAGSDIGEGPAADNDLYLVVKVRTTQQITAGMPKSRGNTTSHEVKTPTRNMEKPQTPSSGQTLKGRRSMMWGSAQRMAKTSRLASLAEQSDNESRDDNMRPKTSDSRVTDPGAPKQGTVSRIVSRTVGIGAVKVNTLMKSVEEAEQHINIWAPSYSSSTQEKQDGDGFDDVVKSFLTSPTGIYNKSRRAERLQVHLKAFNSSDANALIKATPTLLANITQTPKMGFSGAPTKSRSDVYITIDEAYLPRQALLSRPIGGATPMSSSIEARNLQVTLEVRRANEERIEDCIYTSSNSEGTGSWESTAASRGESWSQTLRLVIPTLEVPTCHIVMVIADVPNHPFAICHMPLWDQGAFMRDGHHSLLLYRYDDATSSPLPIAPGKGGYLSLNWSSRGKDDVSKDEAVTGPISTLRLQSYLCSTRFSQDKVLLGLLDWNKQSAEDVQDLLKRLVFVPEIEIVKLLNNVFDAIFGILCEHSGNDDYEDLVFSALVTVLGIVHDRRFNLGPLVDQYAETRFNYPFATPCLVRSFTRLLANPADGETSRRLRATFKVVKHILKFITHARGQQKEKEAGIGITTSSPGFTRHLRTIFKSLDGLMRNTTPILVGSQTLAVQHFHTWLPELTGLLTTEEILHIAIDFVDSCALVKGKLVLYKLVLIINYIKLDLFSQPEQRSALCANTVRWLAPHWGKTNDVTEQWKEQVRLCCSVLSTQINNLGPEIPDYIPKIVDSYLAIRDSGHTARNRLSLLFPTSYPFITKPLTSDSEFDEALVELAAVLSSLSTLPSGMQLELEEEEMTILVEDILRVHLSILECEAFPSNWLSVHIYHHKSTMKALEYISTILHDSFLPQPEEAENFNTELWKAFFTTLLKLVGSNALALETFPEQKRRAVWKIAGDVRETGADLMRRTWEAVGWDTSPDEKQRYGLAKMGGYQVQYVPTLVAPIVELCLSVHEGLRRVAVEVLQTMIVSEWTLSEDLSVIQTEMIDCLDRLFKSEPLTESILQKLFINELHELFEPISHAPEDPLYLALKDLLITIDEFLDLLVAVHSSDATGEASHMMHRLRLMDFLRDMQKEEIFIRYVHQLAQLQVDSRNSTEAGLALRLHADLYDWDPTRMVPALSDPDFPAQTQFERKEKIYFDMIKHFEEGEAWSSALAAYQDLQAQYQDNIYDFSKLARTQRAIATVYETISKAERLVPKFFKVTYRGMGFPSALRDKEFVYEGSPSERTTAFTDRMQEQHPNAQIVTSGDVDDVEGQFLQISALSLHRDLHNHVFQRSRVPQVIRDYLLCDNSQMFSVTSKRNTKGPVEEHSAEKIIYQTAEPFPTILRRSEIISVDRITLSPSQTALERIIRKTAEMVAVEKRMLLNEDDMAVLLVEAIKISVNPNSESTVAHYRQLLPSPPVIDEDDEMEDVEEVELTQIQNALKMALIDHAIMIKRCLAHFAKSDDSSLKERVADENLTQDFETTFAPEILIFTPPPPITRMSSTTTPSWNAGVSSPVVSTHRSSRRIQPSNTFNTLTSTNTSILDTPSNSRRNRLSFLKRNNPEAKEAVLAPITNGNTPESPLRVVQGSPGSHNRDRARDEIATARTRSQSPSQNRDFHGNGYTNRRGSYFSRTTSNTANGAEKEDESLWVTSSDLHSRAGGASISRRSSESQQRPGTALTASVSPGGSGRISNAASSTNGGGMNANMGSVRKRLSLLKLGKKGSKGTMLMGGVREED